MNLDSRIEPAGIQGEMSVRLIEPMRVTVRNLSRTVKEGLP